MVASNIIDGIPKPAARTPASKLLDMHHSTYFQNGKPITVFVAAGPFTTTENLSYDPFRDLLGKVLDVKPDLLILIGI